MYNSETLRHKLSPSGSVKTGLLFEAKSPLKLDLDPIFLSRELVVTLVLPVNTIRK